MTAIHAHPLDGVCSVRGCWASGTVSHHATYDHPWGVIPLCTMHHERIHALYERLRDEIDLTVLTLRYVLEPDAAERGGRRFPRAVRQPIEPRQLSFADLHGRDGQYWRNLMALDHG